MDPAWLIGGELRDDGPQRAGATGEWLVVEADESDRSMLQPVAAELAVVTNVELDHHATFGSLAELARRFGAFLARPGARRRLGRPRAASR